jgi:hypothetical protein
MAENFFSFTYFHGPSAARSHGWPIRIRNGKVRYSAENSPAIFICGGEPWLMSYCWRSQFRRNQYADKSGFQARAERKSYVFPTSPAVAHECVSPSRMNMAILDGGLCREEGRLILVPQACQQEGLGALRHHRLSPPSGEARSRDSVLKEHPLHGPQREVSDGRDLCVLLWPGSP